MENLYTEFAKFLLEIGYGTDFSSDTLPSKEVLEEMVRLAANDQTYVDQTQLPDERHDQAYWMFAQELGYWRE